MKKWSFDAQNHGSQDSASSAGPYTSCWAWLISSHSRDTLTTPDFRSS